MLIEENMKVKNVNDVNDKGKNAAEKARAHAIKVEVEQKSKECIEYFNKHKNEIPNIERLIQKLETDEKRGHIIHADCIKKLFEDKNFEITDVESNKNGFDIDIELNNNINLQIWHGASVSTHKVIEGKVSERGGVPTDWVKDEQKIFEKLNQLPHARYKLNQLPNDNFGLLICYYYHLGITILPEMLAKIPENKAIAELFPYTNECHLYYNPNFIYLETAKQIVTSLGFTVKEMQFKS